MKKYFNYCFLLGFFPLCTANLLATDLNSSSKTSSASSSPRKIKPPKITSHASIAQKIQEARENRRNNSSHTVRLKEKSSPLGSNAPDINSQAPTLDSEYSQKDVF